MKQWTCILHLQLFYVLSFWTQRKIFGSISVTKQISPPIYCHNIYLVIICLVTDFLPNRLHSFVFSGRTEKFTQDVLEEPGVSKWWQNIDFGVNCPFKTTQNQPILWWLILQRPRLLGYFNCPQSVICSHIMLPNVNP